MKQLIKYFLFFSLLTIVASACGSKDLSSIEQHKIVAKKLTTLYIDLHDQYLQLEKDLPDKYIPELEKAAKPMNTARELLSSYLSLVQLKSVSDSEKAQMRKKIQDLINDTIKTFATIRQEYIED